MKSNSSITIESKKDSTIQSLLQWGEQVLERSGVETPGLEARILLSDLLGVDRFSLNLSLNEEVSDVIEEKFSIQIERRSGRYPLAYIQEKAAFLDHEFFVDGRTLIPRPETELLTERAIKRLSGNVGPWPRVLEVGVGSGCIAASLAKAIPNLEVIALDISAEALDVARENAARLNVAHRVRFFQSDLYRSLGKGFQGYFDMIISNPPYVPEADFSDLAPELSFEPRLALEGGSDGLKVIRPLIQQSPAYLKANGILALEIGKGQEDSAVQIAEKAGFSDIQVEKDLNGINRNIFGALRGSV